MFSLAINGRRVEADTEPRLSLADFLREHEFLTGTHIGCEHGVCGACTVLIDGAPARSCITLALACDGAEVTTIEGLEQDPSMTVLREAFSERHALQCGYCTPGMLITARDILMRLPEADERRIRLELSGNLCRCTGYVGIVAAVMSALAQQHASQRVAAAPKRGLGPVGSHPPGAGRGSSRSPRSRAGAQEPPPAAQPAENLEAVDWAAVEREGVELRQSFAVPFPRAQVWDFFSDLERVARCMPGAKLTRPPRDGVAEGEIHVKLGPILSVFQGALAVERDDDRCRGVVRGAGRDAKGPSSARAIIAYDARSVHATATQVDVSVKFLLSGSLAQVSRTGLARDVADHLTRLFARNLEQRLGGAPAGDDAAGDVLDAAGAARSALWARVKAMVRVLPGYFRRKR